MPALVLAISAVAVTLGAVGYVVMRILRAREGAVRGRGRAGRLVERGERGRAGRLRDRADRGRDRRARAGRPDGAPPAPEARYRPVGWRVQARRLGAGIVPLADVDVGSLVTAGKHTHDDLARYAYVLTRAEGSLLDVGCGHGIFLDAYAGGPRAGVDIVDRGEHDWPFQVADADALPFADASWDTVSAQEMLEHQADGKVDDVLRELRRVTRKRLLVTVPFCERRLKSGHVQRFDAARVRSMFPTARYTILRKSESGYPWILIEEDASRT